MSFDKAVRKMIQEEIHYAMGPLTDAVTLLQQDNLANQLSALLGGGIKRGPGRPRKSVVLGRTPTRRLTQTKSVRGSSDRACAVIACKRPVRSKGRRNARMD